MTIFNEAVRLFLAVSALILVGLLSAPLGGIEMKAPESPKVVSVAVKTPTTKGKNAIKLAERKTQRKMILKKSSEASLRLL